MDRPNPTARGETLFVSQYALIERVVTFVCRRNHLKAEDADDFGSHVKLKLVENDYAILGKFEGRSSLQTFLSIVVQRLFLDYRIAAWGKWRPSAEAKRLGAVAILLERLLTRDGYSIDEAYQVMTTNHGVVTTRAALEQFVCRLPARAPRRFESDDVLADVPSGAIPADQVVYNHESQETSRQLTMALRQALAGLGVQDRLILTMRFEDGRTVAEIAAMLHLDQKTLYRRIERSLRDLRSGLEAAGIERAVVLDMLGRPANGLEWASDLSEKAMAGPSMSQEAR